MKGYFCTFALALLYICTTLENVSGQTLNPTDVAAVTSANNLFSNSFYNKYAGQTTGNIVMSPLSVSAVMAMLEAGAGTPSTTSSEIQTGMSFPTNADLFSQYKILLASYMSTSDYTVVLADRIYPQAGFELKTDFVNILQNDFYASVQQLNYSNPTASANTINSWVANVTNNLITNLVSSGSLSADTRLVLVNAIYFKAAWKTKFAPATTSVTFSGCNKTSKVDMMSLTAKNFKYTNSATLKFEVIALPYNGDRFCMIVILPYINCSSALEASLESYNIANLYTQLVDTGVDVYLPKFKIESSINLKPILQNLGMKTMFTTAANFSNIPASGTPQLFVSSIVQKAIIEVDQNGTRAAAATAAVVGTTSVRLPNKITFNANRSFVFFIYDTTAQTVLFTGRKNQ